MLASSGLGMTLFFILSGFVIHYNYRTAWSEPGGIANFVVARFSRLYPLYIGLFAVEFIRATWSGLGACGRAGIPAESWTALPLYLTLTQDWAYGVVCDNSLIFQYGQASQVAWSISLEAFLYIAYVLAGGWISRATAGSLVVGAAIIYALTIVGFLACRGFEPQIETFALQHFGPVAAVANGYQDLLLQWLLYFNPLAHLAEFCGGVAAAALYLERPARASHRSGHGLVAGSLIALLGIHLWLYGSIAPESGFIGRTAAALYAPLAVLFVFLAASFPASLSSRALNLPFAVKFGEASYSIYLLHAFFWGVPRRLFFLGLHPWLLYAGALTAILLISRVSYLWYERPAQRALRRLLSPARRAAMQP